MKMAAYLQILVYMMVYVSSVHSIMVKYGTKDGPIEPPEPEPLPSPQPYRKPAPVWEERNNDTPDPNAHWRPPAFVPQRRYTNIVYKSPTSAAPLPLNNAQRFVLAYKPENKPVTVSDHRSPTVLSSQTLPGIGLRYFYPAEKIKQQKLTKQDDAKLNDIDADEEKSHESDHEFEWKYEKESTRRAIRNNREATAGAPGLPAYQVYQWPIYIQTRHR